MKNKYSKVRLFTLPLMSCIRALRISESSCHFECSWSDFLVQAFFKLVLHSVMLERISLFSSTHWGAKPFLERILYKVSSAGSTCGFESRLRGRPFPGKFSKSPCSIECHILCSTTLTMSVSDLKIERSQEGWNWAIKQNKTSTICWSQG